MREPCLKADFKTYAWKSELSGMRHNMIDRRMFLETMAGAGSLTLLAPFLGGCVSEDSNEGITSSDAAAGGAGQSSETADSPDGTAQAPENNSNVLLVYFSRAGENHWSGDEHTVVLETGNTEVVAGYITDAINCDVFKIEPADPYPFSYRETVARNVEERNADARPAIANLADLPDVDGYDTIVLGCGIWWSSCPMIVRTFLESYDLSGKTIIPFTTYAMSGLGSVVSDYRKSCPDAIVSEDGLAVSELEVNESESSVKEWLSSLRLL